MNGFRNKAQKVPEGIRVFEVTLRIALLGVNKVGEFDRVANEKDWRIITDHVPITYKN